MKFFIKLRSYHRWFYLILSLFWLITHHDWILNHPWLKSSIGIPYFWISFIPFLIMIVYFFYPKFSIWLLILLLFSLGYILYSYYDLNKFYNVIGVKIDASDFWFSLVINILIFIISIGVFIFFKPDYKVKT